MPPRLPRSSSPTDSTRQNGNGTHANGAPIHRTPPISGGNAPSSNIPSFLAPFLGAFTAVVARAAVGAIGYFGLNELNLASLWNGTNKTLMEKVFK